METHPFPGIAQDDETGHGWGSGGVGRLDDRAPRKAESKESLAGILVSPPTSPLAMSESRSETGPDIARGDVGK